MTARSVVGQVEFPSGAGIPCVGARVQASLYSAGSLTYGTANDVAVGAAATLTDNAGSWTLSLEPNANITPAGTVWLISITPPDQAATSFYIEVPDSVGPHDVTDCQAEQPGALPSQALVAHMATVRAHDSQQHYRTDIRDYQADADEADNSTAIQAAIDAAAAAGGGEVVIPATSTGFAFDTKLNVSGSGVVLVGPGRNAPALEFTGTGTAIQFGSPGTLVYRCGMRGVRLNDVHSGGTIGVDLNAAESIFDDLRVVSAGSGWATCGLRVNGLSAFSSSWSNRFNNCHITNLTGDGVRVMVGVNAAMFIGCHFAAVGGDSALISHCNGAKFVACQFERAGSGIEIHVTDRSGEFPNPQVLSLSVTDCYFELLETAAARALLFDGASVGHRFNMRGCYLYATDGEATHAIEANVDSGSVWGEAQGNFAHGFTTALVACKNSLARIGASGLFGHDQPWPAGGGALVHIDNTGGGRGSYTNISDLAFGVSAMRLAGAATVTDRASNGAIGTAAATVDAASMIKIAQTTSGRTLTLPSPSGSEDGRLALVKNTGSVSFAMLGVTVAAGSAVWAVWDASASAWAPVNA